MHINEPITSSSLVIGCDVTASATTTGAESCSDADVIEDQGEDGGPAPAAESTSSASASATITPPPNTPTPAPTSTPSCYLQDEDPDLGINSAYCRSHQQLSNLHSRRRQQRRVHHDAQLRPNNVINGSITACFPEAAACTTSVLNIGYFDECEPDGGLGEEGGASCGSYWTVFTDPQGVTYNPCNDKAIWDDTKAFDGNEIKYSVSEGPFNGGRLTGCVYS
ncbi:hypothetical protein HO133_010294 [Letharia lupina]|uniref:Uncharacterized protein n=1 Tax=Letharia lupina TaxID=560253 RepID=A0A8H6CKG0_9LECA|nr:uncharacterized protein HO133_010294 [Letharia lupina]KAF6225098.1 hypothetical protein HO133_010294 [Letharia lupina]